MPATVPAILAALLCVVGVLLWFLCLRAQCLPFRDHRVRRYHPKRSHHAKRSRAAEPRPTSKHLGTNGLFEAQALNTLIAHRGDWYCPSCWGAASGFAVTSHDLVTLDQIARSRIAPSVEFERAVVGGAHVARASGECVCSQHGESSCLFDRDGARRAGHDTHGWLVRAKPLRAAGAERPVP
jgi:hypothetical protein